MKYSSTMDNTEWMICIEIIVEPVTTGCAHSYCYTCISQSLQYSNTCPVCRTKIEDSFTLQVNRKLAKAIEKIDPQGFKKKKTELQKSHSLESQLQTVRFKYGNTHRKAKKPQKCRTTGYLKKHKWSVYIKSLDKNVGDRKCIEKVVFKLDKASFGKDEEVVQRAPFKFTSTGWGTFDVPMIIFWKSWVNKEPTVLRHPLSFENQGKSNFLCLQVEAKAAKEACPNL